MNKAQRPSSFFTHCIRSCSFDALLVRIVHPENTFNCVLHAHVWSAVPSQELQVHSTFDLFYRPITSPLPITVADLLIEYTQKECTRPIVGFILTSRSVVSFSASPNPQELTLPCSTHLRPYYEAHRRPSFFPMAKTMPHQRWCGPKLRTCTVATPLTPCRVGHSR